MESEIWEKKMKLFKKRKKKFQKRTKKLEKRIKKRWKGRSRRIRSCQLQKMRPEHRSFEVKKSRMTKEMEIEDVEVMKRDTKKSAKMSKLLKTRKTMVYMTERKKSRSNEDTELQEASEAEECTELKEESTDVRAQEANRVKKTIAVDNKAESPEMDAMQWFRTAVVVVIAVVSSMVKIIRLNPYIGSMMWWMHAWSFRKKKNLKP